MDPTRATELWQALAAGDWTIVDHIDRDERRFLLARENAPHVGAAHALTAREREVVEHASTGRSDKDIAWRLGVSASTVSTHLSQAARKLGVHSRSAVIHTHAALAGRDTLLARVVWGDQRFAVLAMSLRRRLPRSLSPAERAVVALVVAGKANAQTARARGVSKKTIAKQVAAAMKKLGVSSRSELTARVLRSDRG
jgi:DNA-binding CsgD family transcriptional regulator